MREHIVINSDRSVTVPDSLKKIGIQYDHNVNTLTFDCPRYADDAQSIDMSKMQIFINWMLPDKSIGSSIAENIIIDEADSTLMHFDWIITSAVTSVFGILERTLVCIKQTDTDGREIYHWNTDLFQKFSVGEGMECNEQLAEENMDVITQLLVKMDAIDTRTSTEAMRSYVSEYMTENPPQPSDEQANAGVDAYMTENGQDYVNTYMGENAQSAVNTYMDVNAQSKVNTYMEENAQEHMDTYMEQNAQNKVDDYLERNPLQLDNTLTDPTKAAPADKVGEIGTEVTELKGDIAQLDNTIFEDDDFEFDITQDRYILPNGNVSNSNNYWNYVTVNVAKGDIFYFTSITNSTDVAGVCIKDSNGNVLFDKEQITYNNYKIIVPENASVMYLSYYKSEGYSLTKKKNIITTLKNNVELINQNIDEMSVSELNYTYISGKYINASGNEQSNSYWGYTSFDVNGGEEFIYNCLISASSVTGIVAKDQDNNVIDTVSKESFNNYEYNVPNTCRKVYFSFPLSSIPTISKKQFLMDITSRIDALENNSNIVECYGDSLTQGNQDRSGNTYPLFLQGLLGDGYSVKNFGAGGDTSYDIGARQGGVPMYVEPCTIPSGRTEVEIILKSSDINNTEQLYTSIQQQTLLQNVSIGGVLGRIAYASGSAPSTCKFLRYTDGNKVILSRPTTVITESMRNNNNIQIIWCGTNDAPQNIEDLKNITIPHIDNMIRFMRGTKYIIVGLTSKNYMPQIEEINKYMARYYSSNFVNLRDYILQYGLSDANITPTSQDETDILNGEIPTSLRTDRVHLNQYGYSIVANLVYKKGVELGYWI